MPFLTTGAIAAAGLAATAASSIVQVANSNAARDEAKKAMDAQNQKEQQLEADAKNQQANQAAQNDAAAQRDAAIQKQRGLNQQGRAGTILTGGIGMNGLGTDNSLMFGNSTPGVRKTILGGSDSLGG